MLSSTLGNNVSSSGEAPHGLKKASKAGLDLAIDLRGAYNGEGFYIGNGNKKGSCDCMRLGHGDGWIIFKPIKHNPLHQFTYANPNGKPHHYKDCARTAYDGLLFPSPPPTPRGIRFGDLPVAMRAAGEVPRPVTPYPKALEDPTDADDEWDECVAGNMSSDYNTMKEECEKAVFGALRPESVFQPLSFCNPVTNDVDADYNFNMKEACEKAIFGALRPKSVFQPLAFTNNVNKDMTNSKNVWENSIFGAPRPKNVFQPLYFANNVNNNIIMANNKKGWENSIFGAPRPKNVFQPMSF